MKRQKLQSFFSLIMIVAVLATSCSKKTITPLANSLFTTNPSPPLELVGTKVPVTINGRSLLNGSKKKLRLLLLLY